MNKNKSNTTVLCIKKCKYNHEKDKCEGCGRSMMEIRAAYSASNPNTRTY